MSDLIAQHVARKLMAEIESREAIGDIDKTPSYKNRIRGSAENIYLFLKVPIDPDTDTCDLGKINQYLKHGWKVYIGPNNVGTTCYIATRKR